jgi:YD repeat-containing protein
MRSIRLHSTAAALMIGILWLWPIETSMGADASVTYQYDAAGRVVAATYNNGLCVTYTYDLTGNRLSKTTNACTTASPGTWGSFNWNQVPWG